MADDRPPNTAADPTWGSRSVAPRVALLPEYLPPPPVARAPVNLALEGFLPQ